MNSAFHLSYNMVLNLLRVEGISPEFMLERCFYTFQNDANIPQYERGKENGRKEKLYKMKVLIIIPYSELLLLEKERDSMKIEQEEEIQSYYEIRKQLESYKQDVRDVVNHPSYCLPFMQPGRLVRIKHLDMDFGWGAVVNYSRAKSHNNRNDTDPAPPKYILDVLLYCDKNSTLSKDAEGKTIGVTPALPDADGTPLVSSRLITLMILGWYSLSLF